MAELDYPTARQYREKAEENLKLRKRLVDLYAQARPEVPSDARRALATAKLEYKHLNRICLRHAARRLDASLRAEGRESEMESAVMFWDVTNPLAEAV